MRESNSGEVRTISGAFWPGDFLNEENDLRPMNWAPRVWRGSMGVGAARSGKARRWKVKRNKVVTRRVWWVWGEKARENDEEGKKLQNSSTKHQTRSKHQASDKTEPVAGNREVHSPSPSRERERERENLSGGTCH